MIGVINPNASSGMTQQLMQECASIAIPGHELCFYQCDAAPPSIEGYSDGVEAAYWVTQTVRRLEGVDNPPSAYVIACFDDTGLDAARELTCAPVLGIGEASMHAATMVSSSFCVMTALERSVPILTRNLRHYGLHHRCAGVFASRIPVLELERSPDSYDRVLAVAKQSLEQTRGESLVLGCAGMSSWVSRMEADLGMPVLDGVRIGVAFAGALVSVGLGTSKVLSYGFPEMK